MIIKPKIRGFVCITTHPVGCDANVRSQIAVVRARPKFANGPKRALVIGASTGYGLASRISAAFASGAATVGVFLEREPAENRPATVTPREALRSLIDQNIGAVGASLPTGMNPERFARLLLTAALMKYGSLPHASDPDKPTPEEISAIKEKIKLYQSIFQTH